MIAIYSSLFFSALISATLLPGTSEVLLVGFVSQGYDAFILWLIATSGNTFGSSVNWLLGKYLLHYQDRPWFPFKQKSLDTYQEWFQRYGSWSLLFAWVPVIGDPLTFIAGVMRVKFILFFLLTAIGKGFRYGFIIGALNFFVVF